MLSVHNFSYGLLTPALAYLMSFVGSFLGLRCTTRARAATGSSRLGWLLVAGVAIGITGIWVMHFIAMLGFTIPGETIGYNVPVTLASMLIAVAFVSIGLLIVGRGRMRAWKLLLGGLITGIGVAAMHYSGMAAMRMPAHVSYDPTLFALSVVVAVVAATAALWATLALRGLAATLGAAAIMGVAVSGMHYTGMAALRAHEPGSVPGAIGGVGAEAFLLPLIIGVSLITFVLTAVIALSPTDDEMAEDAELMRRLNSVQAQNGDVAVQPVAAQARQQIKFARRPSLPQLVNAARQRAGGLAAACLPGAA